MNQPARMRLLSVSEVATAAGVSKMTVYRWVHNGELSAVKTEGAYQVPAAELDDFLKRRQTGAAVV